MNYLAIVIGKRVRRLRTLRGLRQKEISDVSVGTLSDLERGKSIPRVRILDSIAKALRVPLADLFVERAEAGGDERAEARAHIDAMLRNRSAADLRDAGALLELAFKMMRRSQRR